MKYGQIEPEDINVSEVPFVDIDGVLKGDSSFTFEKTTNTLILGEPGGSEGYGYGYGEDNASVGSFILYGDLYVDDDATFAENVAFGSRLQLTGIENSAAANGDFWLDQSSGKFSFRQNGTTITLLDNNPIDGSGATNQVAYWSDSDTITGDSNFTWDGNQVLLNNPTNAQREIFRINQQNGSEFIDFIVPQNGSNDGGMFFANGASGGKFRSYRNGVTADHTDNNTYTEVFRLDSGDNIVFGAVQSSPSASGNEEIQFRVTDASTNQVRIGGPTNEFVVGSDLDVVINSTTDSTSSTTGALVVGGGAGFGGRVTINNGTITTSDEQLHIDGEWNNSSETFSAFVVEITNTASQSNSHLMRVDVDGSTVWQLDVGGDVFATNNYEVQRAVATLSGYQTSVVGDSDERFEIRADGRITWGSGSAARDTNLYRDSADVLKTDDSFIVDGDLTVNTNFSANEITATSTADPTETSTSIAALYSAGGLGVAGDSAFDGDVFFGIVTSSSERALLINSAAGADGVFSIIDDDGNKVCQFGSSALNLNNTGGADATDYSIKLFDASGEAGGGNARSETISNGTQTGAWRSSDGAAVFGGGTFVADAVSVDFSTASTSSTTGALVVTGGVGISGRMHADQGIDVPSQYQSSTIGNRTTEGTLPLGINPSSWELTIGLENLSSNASRAGQLITILNQGDSNGFSTIGSHVLVSGVTGAADSSGEPNVGYSARVNAINGSTASGDAYGAYFVAVGAANGGSAAYGIYATASSADTNWAGYFEGNVNITETLNPTDPLVIGTPGGAEGSGYGYGPPGASTGEVIIYGTLYVDDDVTFAENVSIAGKLTVDGLIDPTGLELTPQAANPGGITANTVWLDSGNSNRWTFETPIAALDTTQAQGSSGVLTDGAIYTEGGIVARKRIYAESIIESATTIRGTALRASGSSSWSGSSTGFSVDLREDELAITNDSFTIRRIDGIDVDDYITFTEVGGLGSNVFRIDVEQDTEFISGTASTSSTTGALVVTGGVGISDALHTDSTTQATSGQYGGSLTTQGGIRGGYGLSSDQCALFLTVGSGSTTRGRADTYATWINLDRTGPNAGDIAAAISARAGANSGATVGPARGDVVGIQGIADYDDNGRQCWHPLIGVEGLTRNTTGPQDVGGSAVRGTVNVGDGTNIRGFRQSSDEVRWLIGVEADVDVHVIDSSREKYVAGFYADVASTDTGDDLVTAQYGGYFTSSTTVDQVTTNYGIYATASGGVTNWAGYFEGDVIVTGALENKARLETVTTTGTLTRENNKKVKVTASSITVSLWTSGIEDGDQVFIRNSSGGSITIDTAGSETIEGSSTETLVDGESRLYVYDSATTDWTVF